MAYREQGLRGNFTSREGNRPEQVAFLQDAGSKIICRPARPKALLVSVFIYKVFAHFGLQLPVIGVDGRAQGGFG